MRACAVLVVALPSLVNAQTWDPGAPGQEWPRESGGHAMAFDTLRGRVVLFGGSDEAAHLSNETWEYDGTTWARGAAPPADLLPRWNHAMAFAPGVGTVMIGGTGSSLLGDTWVYDGITWTRITSTSLPAPRAGHAAAYHAGLGSVVLFGGMTDAGPVADTWELKGTSWRESPAAPAALVPRHGHALAYHPGTGVVLFGGDASNGDLLADTWFYDGTSWISGPVSAIPPRRSHALAFDARAGRTVLYGGAGAGAPGLLDDTWLFDGATWAPGPAAPPDMEPRQAHAMVADAARGRLVVFGGAGWRVLDDTWELVSGAWNPGPRAPLGLTPRSDAAMTYDAGRARAVLFGGWNGVPPFFGDLLEYDGRRWAPAPLASGEHPTPRADAGLAYDSTRRRLLLFGGDDDNYGLRNDLWSHDAEGWSSIGPLDTFRGPTAAAAAFDEQRHVVVLYGGYDNGLTNKTWEYDGTSWSLRPPPPSALGPRAEHAMAFNPDAGAVMLFGGYTPSLKADLWTYEGRSWTLVPVAAAPSPRYGHAMVYDRARRSLVVFAGVDAGGALLNDTWRFDGAAWSLGPAPPANLAPRRGHAMAFDEARGVTVLFGGYGGAPSSSLRDTWELGSTWTPSQVLGPRPLAREGHAMAYDSARARTVLVGGSPLLGLDAWEFDGVAWRRAPAPAGPPTHGHVLAFDRERGRSVLVLGPRTFEYDGSAWHLLPAPPPLPEPRKGHALAYDPLRDRLVLFGGTTEGANPPIETWEFDGAGWTQRASAPPAMGSRQGHAMVFHELLQMVALVAGADGVRPNIVYADLWLYDGNAWVPGPRPPTLFAPRADHAAAYDSTREVLLVHGGRSGGQLLDDTWLFDGAGWTQGPSPALGMTPREHHAMAFDAARGTLVLAAGADSTFRDDTWELPLSRPQFAVSPGPAAVNPARIRVVDTQGVPTSTDFLPYPVGWGARLAAASISPSPFGSILTGPGPGPTLGPHVRGFAGDGQGLPKVSFYAYGTLRYGVHPAAGDVDVDPYAEILTAAGPGAVFGPHVRAFDYDGGDVRTIGAISFYAYNTLKYGVLVAAGDVDGIALDELLTAPGPGPSFVPHVRGFAVSEGVRPIPRINFSAFPGSYGARIAAGDVDEDGSAELLVAPGPGPTEAAHVHGFDDDGDAIAPLPGADLAPFTTYYGVVLSSTDVGSTAASDVIVAAGQDPVASSSIKSYWYDGSTMSQLRTSFLPFSTAYGAAADAQLLR